MSDNEKPVETNATQANNHSTAVGNFEVSKDLNGNVNLGGTQNNTTNNITNVYYTVPETAKSVDFINKKIDIQYFEPETILIPDGNFWMGNDPGEGIPSYETPRHEIFLPVFRIGKYPVTNVQYQEFIIQTKTLVSRAMKWDGQSFPVGKENHPVTGVSFNEALAYCRWLSEETEHSYSIPNEAQWEKACRGEGKSFYPWGDEFDDERCNHGRPTVAAVDAYSAQSAYGCYDLVGNVRQWTCTLWGMKPITPDPEYNYLWKPDRRNDLNANRQIRRVLRGSTMKDAIILHRCSARSSQIPEDRGLPGERPGFRVVMAVK